MKQIRTAALYVMKKYCRQGIARLMGLMDVIKARFCGRSGSAKTKAKPMTDEDRTEIRAAALLSPQANQEDAGRGNGGIGAAAGA